MRIIEGIIDHKVKRQFLLFAAWYSANLCDNSSLKPFRGQPNRTQRLMDHVIGDAMRLPLVAQAGAPGKGDQGGQKRKTQHSQQQAPRDLVTSRPLFRLVQKPPRWMEGTDFQGSTHSWPDPSLACGTLVHWKRLDT